MAVLGAEGLTDCDTDTLGVTLGDPDNDTILEYELH